MSIEKQNYIKICVIVNYGLGSKVINVAKQEGIRGGTILLGKGTLNNPILKFLSLHNVRKELVVMVAEENIGKKAMDVIYDKFQLNKPHHGIAFITEVLRLDGLACPVSRKEEKLKTNNFKLINIIVNLGDGEAVIAAANEAGSSGGTILDARGSGIQQTAKIFNMEIEPQKELVMIIASEDKYEAICDNIVKKIDLEAVGKGILFVQDVKNAYGIVKD